VTGTNDGRPVIVGVDASQHAGNAADWAAAEACERGVHLRIIHALDFDPGSAHMGPATDPGTEDTDPSSEIHLRLLAQVESRLRALHPDLVMTAGLVHQGAAGALVAASRDAGLLVLGTRGRGGFAGLALGSVSLRVAAHTASPAVLVGAGGHDYARRGDIVLGVEHGGSEEAVLFAFEQAARAGLAVRAVRAWESFPGHSQFYIRDTDILARQAADDVVATLSGAREKFPEVPVHLSVQLGHPAAVLADASQQARLTVVGAHRHHGPLSIGVGPIIHALLARAQSPVAVVPVH
jgi:nucleotide-binding universal stress UspA family protein